MSASLVGSEMCIRDSGPEVPGVVISQDRMTTKFRNPGWTRTQCSGARRRGGTPKGSRSTRWPGSGTSRGRR
eukprot:12993798-Alexandrium_andersonii.AAC.1